MYSRIADGSPFLRRFQEIFPGGPTEVGLLRNIGRSMTRNPEDRQSYKDLQEELDFSRLMAHVGVGPRIFAHEVHDGTSHAWPTASAVVPHGEELSAWLQSESTVKGEGHEMAQKLMGLTCTVADLGFCFCDMKPANALVFAGNELRLSDFDPEWCVYMDPELMRFFLDVNPFFRPPLPTPPRPLARSRVLTHFFQKFSPLPPKESLGSKGWTWACAHARGASVCIMTFLMYLFLATRMARPGVRQGRRLFEMRESLQAILKEATFPLDLFSHICEGKKGSARGKGKLGRALHRITEHYWGEGASLKDLANKHELFEGPGHANEVKIMQVSFTDETSSCVKDAAGNPRRRHAMTHFLDRSYPCDAIGRLKVGPSWAHGLQFLSLQTQATAVGGVDVATVRRVNEAEFTPMPSEQILKRRRLNRKTKDW